MKLAIMVLNRFILMVVLLGLFTDVKSQAGVIVFLQKSAPASSHFEQTTDSALAALASEMSLTYKTVYLEDKVPTDIKSTPAIVFQNHIGRSLYNGRYSNLKRIKNFLRISATLQSPAKPIEKKSVLSASMGRMKLLAPIKITPLTGAVPANFDFTSWHKKICAEVLEQQLEKFKYKDVDFYGKGDKAFYMNFYPYKSEDEQLYLSLELYSQYNCIEPIFITKEPLVGTWAESETLFERAAKLLVDEVFRQQSQSYIGDRFESVSLDFKTVTYEELGFHLPEAPVNAKKPINPADFNLAGQWQGVEPVESDLPMLQFKFPAPLDHYGGEATEISGKLQLGRDNVVNGTTGEFVVVVKSVTMGDVSLDNSLHDYMLDAATYPTAVFKLENVSGADENLSFGTSIQASISGTFTMKGKTIKIEQAKAAFEPTVNNAGELRLWVTGSFAIRLQEPFGISGPSGPSPANDTVEFLVGFYMKPEN